MGSFKEGIVAVLAGGLGEVYPPENADLFKQVATKGLLVTAMPIGTKPNPCLFSPLTSIIDALSLCFCATETAFKLGSLIKECKNAERV